MFGHWNDTYAMNMLQLQEKCGLTYKEARAFLIRYRESVSVMAMDLGLSSHSVYNLQRRAKRKVESSGHTLKEIFGEYMPIDRGPVMVTLDDTASDLRRLLETQ